MLNELHGLEIVKKCGVQMKAKDFNMRILPIRKNIVRCTYSKKPIKKTESLLIEKGITDRELPITTINESEEYIYISTTDIQVEIKKKTGVISWKTGKGEKLLLQEGSKEFSYVPIVKYTTGKETPIIERKNMVDGERNFIKNLKEVVDHEALQGRIYFEFQKEEGIFGLGQAEEGVYNYRNHIQYLYQHNMRIPMPMFVSSNGYGIVFDACCLMTFHDVDNESYMFFDAIEQLDYYVVQGNSLDDIISGFRYLTGKATMLPKWSFGYIQSKEQYYTADELADVIRRYRELQIPIDCVVQDWNSWESGLWGQKSVDKIRYGNLQEKITEIHEMNAHTMVSVWPNMHSESENYKEMSQAGNLLHDLSTYDAFSEKARKMYWKQAKEGLFNLGFESWWCDSTEPFSGPDWCGAIKREPWERYYIVGKEHKKYIPAECANVYSLLHAKGIYENQRDDTEDIRVLNLTRSGYASGQKYGAMLWSGDTTASWEVMKKQITEGLNMAMSGYPYWTLDIGGFFTVGEKWQNRGCSCNTISEEKWFWKGKYDDGVKDKGYCELYTRWIQFGAFLPMFRSHGTDTPREIWNFGEPGTIFFDSIEKYIKLRYKLMPYIYSLAGDVVQRNGTIMRSLLFDFSHDMKAKTMSEEFFFGKSLLVCPVLKPMYYKEDNEVIVVEKKWNCYLPSGADFYDFWDGTFYNGGREICVNAPIDVMPIFVKAGSIIPMKSDLQYALEENGKPLEIHVYTGQDAKFTLYEDSGNDYMYEKGEFAEIDFEWNEREKTLIIHERQGSYRGMANEQCMHIFVNQNMVKEVTYNGTIQKIVL